MRYSNITIPTLKKAPLSAKTISNRLMLRSGMIKKISAGIYTFLPIGVIVLSKIKKIIRDEMRKLNSQEIIMPLVQPAEIWKRSGRWDEYGPELLRFQDRKKANFCLGPTHEEVATHHASELIKSYKQLPLSFFQINTKFRDEIRPRFGVMRAREFLMKDAYSFHLNEKSAIDYYNKMKKGYENIFSKIGLLFQTIEASTGNIGGKLSHEFQILAESGEDTIVSCETCKRNSNLELSKAIKINAKKEKIKKFAFRENEEKEFTVFFSESRKINEHRLSSLIKKNFENIKKTEIISDTALASTFSQRHKNFIISDITDVKEGDLCLRCKKVLTFKKGIEVGHIFYLGNKYSKAMGLKTINYKQKECFLKMGCYGIGVSRLIAAIIEQCNDEHGIIWPKNVAPFDVELISLKSIHESEEQYENLYSKLKKENIETLYDNRQERTGAKFKDADLIGCPIQIIASKKLLQDKKVEVNPRKEKNLKPKKINIENLSEYIKELQKSLK